jgi:NAD+ synthase (glutamine-hydrolysing)
MRTFRLAMAQVNVTVGDMDGNTKKVIEYIQRARDLQADLVAFPELAIPGYPPEDLVFKTQFIRDNLERMHQVAKASTGIAVVVGFVDADSDAYNAAAIAYDGKLAGIYHKMYLPNYGVFDEDRYFKAGTTCPVYVINGTTVGVNICEDIWYATGPTTAQRRAGAEVIVNINGSPFHMGKRALREKMLATRAMDNGVYVAYANLVGGQDELVFDGGSVVMGPQGDVVARGPQFEEALVVADLGVETVLRSRLRDSRPRKERAAHGHEEHPAPVVRVSEYAPNSKRPTAAPTIHATSDEVAEVYQALVTGTRDYVHKCGFTKVLIGLSGGVDSSLVAVVAADALGKENVIGVAMPSRFSSDDSMTDAKELARNLGIEFKVMSIEPAFTAYLDTLAPHFEGTKFGLAEENLQARTRGNLIMGLSNKFGWMVLTTGNKSEMATGYATLYGDMAGGFAVIKDVPKTLVYKLVDHRNARGRKPVVPRRVIEKAPTAELRPNQKDEDSLPPYAVLDPILKAYVEEDKTLEEIVGLGYQQETVRRVIDLVDRSEYKRRQAPPGVKITPRNFGRDRRMPIANRYRPY